MVDILEEENRNGGVITLRDRIRNLESKLDKAEKSQITEKNKKVFKFPFKWKWKLWQSNAKNKEELALVIYFNKKNEIEPPTFMPIFSGNMIVYKNKAYEFDPRAIWTMKGVRGFPRVYCIREIDRRPIKNHDGTFKRDREGRIIYGRDAAISNLDIDEVRERGDSTESDEFLIKAALKAQTSQIPVNSNWIIGGIVGMVIIGVLIWLFTKGG